METEYIEFFKMQVEHANRVSDVVLSLSGIIVSVSIFVVGYQVFLNKRTVQKIKQENKTLITETIKPLFITSLGEQTKLGGVNYYSIKDSIAYYNSYLKDDEESTKEIQYFLVKCIISKIRNFNSNYVNEKNNSTEMYRTILEESYNQWLRDYDRYNEEKKPLNITLINDKEHATTIFKEGLAITEDLDELLRNSDNYLSYFK